MASPFEIETLEALLGRFVSSLNFSIFFILPSSTTYHLSLW